jgi:drug/metabolite transporter (DMT)-like permease
MLWLALCIVFTSCLIISFKHFEQWNIKILPAITFNYVTCSLLGLLTQQNISLQTVSSWQHWMTLSVLLGFAFIVVYYLLSMTTVRNGVTVGAIANKLSVVIPVTIAIMIYGEKATLFKIIGILLALASVILTNIKNGNSEKVKAGILLPVIVFIGSGLSDSLLNYIQRFHLADEYFGLFIGIVFSSAFLLGITATAMAYFFKKETFGLRDIVAGLILGIPNFGSMFTILKALQSPSIEDSVVWTLNNMGVIVFATIYAVFVFKEKLNRYNIAGILLALFAIMLIMAS